MEGFTFVMVLNFDMSHSRVDMIPIGQKPLVYLPQSMNLCQ